MKYFVLVNSPNKVLRSKGESYNLLKLGKECMDYFVYFFKVSSKLELIINNCPNKIECMLEELKILSN